MPGAGQPSSPLTSLLAVPRSRGRAGSRTQHTPALHPCQHLPGEELGEAPGLTLKQLSSKTSRRMSHGLHCWPQPCPSPGLSVPPFWGQPGTHMAAEASGHALIAAGMRVSFPGVPGMCIPAHAEVLEVLARRGDELTGYSRPC